MRITFAALALVTSFVLWSAQVASAADPLPRDKPEAVGMSSERLATIRKVIDAEVAADRIPGGVLAVARRGKLVHFEAYGYLDKAAGTPMRTDAIFNIASPGASRWKYRQMINALVYQAIVD
ncbi:MAG: serine hydrolase [Hyphomicrobiales bacterium]|nr:serine hydrolase [Hyphomicrobiales bacterium]